MKPDSTNSIQSNFERIVSRTLSGAKWGLTVPCGLLICLCGPVKAVSRQAQQQPGPISPTTSTKAQDEVKVSDEQERRRIWRSYRETRPAARPTHRKPPRIRPSGGRDSVTAEITAPHSGSENNFIGFTLWQMRAASAVEVKESRSIRQKKNPNAAWTPIRMGTDDNLSHGQLTRLSVESARQGYLYVINREEFANGSLGEPFLIFPTRTTRGGDNQVSAGDLVEIPDQQDDPPFFTVERTRSDQVGEVLLIIVSPKPLITASRIKDEPLALPADKVEEWEKLWGAGVKRVDDREGVGKAYTKMEHEASSDTHRKLTNVDPIPQTIFRVPAGFGNPTLVKVRLRYAPEKATPRENPGSKSP